MNLNKTAIFFGIISCTFVYLYLGSILQLNRLNAAYQKEVGRIDMMALFCPKVVEQVISYDTNTSKK